MEKIVKEPLQTQKKSFEQSLEETFDPPVRDWKQYSPLTLAYIGDAVYEVVIRTVAVRQEDIQPQKLHRKVTACVSAKAQAMIMQAILPLLDGEEMAIYRRGRNAKPYTKAKNASFSEYLTATGFEAVIGYLYLEGRFARMNELIKEGLENGTAQKETGKENEETAAGQKNEDGRESQGIQRAQRALAQGSDGG